MTGSYDHAGNIFAASGFEAKCLLAPWRTRCLSHTVTTTVTTTVRVIYGVHNHTTYTWALTHVA